MLQSINIQQNNGLEPYAIVIIVVAVLLFLITIFIGIGKKASKTIKQNNVKEKVQLLASNQIEMTPDEFFKMRNLKGKRGMWTGKYALNFNFKGVYILHNETKNMYYVGQAIKILNRVNDHFTGKGNGDVYADYKYGDSFKIMMVGLKNSGYTNLNELEHDMIETYDAVNKGYNKTSGNKTPYKKRANYLYSTNKVNMRANKLINRYNNNKEKYKNELKIGLKKIEQYAKFNTDWFLETKLERVNFFYENKTFFIKKAATWHELIDQKIEYTLVPISRAHIQKTIEPIYANSKNKEIK